MAKGLNLKAILSLDARQFQQGIGKIQQQLGSIGSAMKQAFAIGSVAMFGKSVLMATKNFEDAMARAKAVSNATAGQMKMMTDEALRLGATTRYTATQVAETLEVLTRNGFSAEKATKSLAATLQLAQANAVGLADAGNMITNTLNMFGLSVNEVQRVNDVMSSIASNTATNLQDFYDALVNAAPMAHALGISIEETAAALGSLAQRGIKGSDAGTQLRMALQKMVDPSAMKKMKALGIEIDEEIIKAEGLKGVLEKLNAANLSVSQLNEIFTVRSSKSILQLVRAVDDFNAILEITKNSSGTTFRMFEEGVGSVRKELDVLRSVWENFMINMGTASSGPIKGVLKTLQNFITSIQTKMGFLTNIGAGIAIALTGRLKHITTFFSTLSNLRNKDLLEEKLANEERLRSAELQDLQDAKDAKIAAKKILRRKKITLEEQKAAQISLQNAEILISASEASIAARDREIASLQREITAINTLKATLKSLAISAIWIAAVTAITAFINHLIAANKALKDARDRLKEVGKENQNLISKVEMLKDMIGNGQDRDSLAAAVSEATRTFSEFSQEIKNAYIEAGKTGNYEKLKKLLEDIAKLQNTVRAQQANQALLDAQRDKYAEYLSNMSGPTARQIRGGLAQQGYTTDEAQNAFYQGLADVLINNRKSADKGFKAVTDYLERLGIKLDFEKEGDKIMKWFEKATSDVVTKGLYIKYKTDSPYKLASQANDRQQDLTQQANTDERNIRINSAFETYNMAVAQAALDFTSNSKEYKDALADAAANLKSAVGDMYNDMDWNQRNQYDEIQRQYGRSSKTSSTIGDAGSGSSKKTEWEKFTDLLDEYPKKVNELDNQLHNHAITQAEYDKEIVKLNLDTWKAIAAISDLDSKMKSLSKERVDTINTVKANVPQDPDVANAYSELVNALHDFDKKKIEIVNKNEQGAYADPSEYMDALMDLEDETYNTIVSLKGLDQAVGFLNDPLKTLYGNVIDAGKANKAYADKLKKLETPNTLPPQFTGRDAQDVINKRDQYADVVRLLNEYEKQRLKLDMQRDKKAITDDQYNESLTMLNTVVGISLGQFRSMNEIVSKLPTALKAFYDELMNFKPKNGNDEPAPADEGSFMSVLDDYYDKSLRLLEQKVNGSLDNTTYERELQKLAQETIVNIKHFDKLGSIVGMLPQKYQEVYNALVKLKGKIENTDINAGDNGNPTAPKIPGTEEAAPTVEVNPVVNVTVNVDGQEVGKNINVEVDTTPETGTTNTNDNKSLIDTIKAWQKTVEKANKTKQEIEIEEELGLEDIEIKLDLKQDEIDRIKKRIEDLMSEGENKNGIVVFTEETIAELNNLMAALKKAMSEAETLGEMKVLANGIVQLQSGMDSFAKTAIDNISNVASAFDRLMSAIESIAEAFGQELEWEGLKKVMSVINGTIQVMEALRSIIVTVQAVQDIATKKKVANASKEVIANAAVTASEETKAAAEASEAVAGAGSSVASIPYVGAALAIAAIAAITAALLAGMGKFENGGILQGSSSHGDKNVYRGNRGEMVINRAQQGSLYRAIAEGRLGGGGPVEFIIRGDTLVGILKNHERKWS